MPEVGTEPEPTPDTLFDSSPVPREQEDTTQRVRALASKFSKTQIVNTEDGILVRGVPLLAAGTWTDSAVGTPLNYPSETLREYAAAWTDLSVWSRHLGNTPRDVTDKVGEVVNPRFENDAIVGDLLLHGVTQKSRDAIELVRRKLISYVSVEHTGQERFNPKTRAYEASSLSFRGLALVNKGACQKCRINEAPPETVRELTIRQEGEKWVIYSKEGKKLGEFDSEDAAKKRLREIEYFKHREQSEPEPEPAKPEENMVDIKELETVVSAVVKRELEAIKPAESPKIEIPKELSDAIEDLREKNRELTAQITELKKAPAAPVTTPPKERALEDSTPQFFVKVDRKAGIVG